jgi:hypothetical protein
MEGSAGKTRMLYIALLHYPVINKEGRVVATSIANMDIHDIARTAKTYGVERYYVVNPVALQRELAAQIVSHWREGHGALHNLFRKEAFETVHIQSSLDDVISDITARDSNRPKLIVTGAGFQGDLLTCCRLRQSLKSKHLPYLLIFGTGSGIAEEIVLQADYRLEPIQGKDGYNHLSVRSAVAIILDRVADIS